MQLAINSVLHLLTPKESNNYKAKLLHNKSLLLLVLGIFIYQIGVSLLSTHPTAVLGYASQISPDKVIELTNQKRKEAGLSSLSYNQDLAKAASLKAADMINRDYWAHVGPDGTQPWKFFNDVNYKYKYAGENLARDFHDPQSAVDAWMASPSHKENLLSSKYQDIGVAVIEGDLSGHDTTIVVQLFGTKLGKQNSTITNVSAADSAPKAVLEDSASNENKVTLQPQVASASLTSGEQISVSSFDATRYGYLMLSVILGSIIFIDAFIVWRNKIPRISGRAFAHISFIGMIIVVLVIMKAGKVI